MDPSFQVMGDMLDKILSPLKRAQIDEKSQLEKVTSVVAAAADVRDATPAELKRVKSTDSLDSIESSASRSSHPDINGSGYYRPTKISHHS